MKLTLGIGKSAVREARTIETALDVADILVRGAPIDRTRYDRAELDALKSADGWYSFAAYRGARRAADEIVGNLSVLSFDIDDGSELSDFSMFSGVVLETATSAPGERRWRVHLDLTDPIEPARYSALVEAFGAAYGINFDRAARDPARLWYRRVVDVAQELTGVGLAWKALFDLPEHVEQVDTSEGAPELTPSRKAELIGLVEQLWPRSMYDMSGRAEWIESGMAIHASTGGDAWGLKLWEQLSRRCPDKFADGIDSCAHAWQTFKSTGARVTLETLAGKLAVTPEDFPQGAADFRHMAGQEYDPLKIEWLWRDHLARGALHLLAGAPGVGKSQAALGMAAAVTVGGHWPDGTKAPRGPVVIFTPEDDVRTAIMPRFLAAGGDRSMIFHCDRREALIPMLKAIRPTLLVLDPITSGLTDQNDAAKVREQLEPFAQLARDLDVTVLGLTHFAKRSSDLPTIERVLGSTSFTAVARVVMAMASGEQGNVFAVVKSNIGKYGDPRLYTIEGVTVEKDIETSRIVWGNKLMVDSVESAFVTKKPERDGPRNHARLWLLSALEHGPRLAAEILDEGINGEGYSDSTIKRAKKELGDLVRSYQKERQWYWCLAKQQETLEQLLGVSADEQSDDRAE